MKMKIFITITATIMWGFLLNFYFTVLLPYFFIGTAPCWMIGTGFIGLGIVILMPLAFIKLLLESNSRA